jgi:hypothetical protein
MTTNLEKYKADLKRLVEIGQNMNLDLAVIALEREGTLNKEAKEVKKRVSGSFERDYQRWYTEAHAVLRQLLPERLAEFEVLYKGDGKRREVSASTFTIQDWLTGIRSGLDFEGVKRFDDAAGAAMRFSTQLAILSSAEARFETSLFDIRQIVQADLFDSELEASRELLKNGFLRASGALAGVVLEKHLAVVAKNHNLGLQKKHPSISPFNDLLKDNGVTDVPTWRFIQRLGDLRNVCAHGKEREPSKEEVRELIDGTDKITKTLF